MRFKLKKLMEKLSLELLHNISGYLGVREYYRFGLVNKYIYMALPLHECRDQDQLWKYVYKVRDDKTACPLLIRMKRLGKCPEKKVLYQTMQWACQVGSVSLMSLLLTSFGFDFKKTYINVVLKSGKIEAVTFLKCPSPKLYKRYESIAAP